MGERRFLPPLKVGRNGLGYRYNVTLHGRSIYRPYDIPGHNVFKGYTTWARTGKAVGDALDCFAPAWTPVYAMHNGVQTVWRNDTTKREVIYIEGGGVTTVYAHIDAAYEGTGIQIRAGQMIGRIRGDLNDPHLHLEVWVDGKAIAAPSSGELARKLAEMMQGQSSNEDKIRVNVLGRYLDDDDVMLCDGETWVKLRPMAEAAGLHVYWRPDLRKVFVKSE